MSVDKIRFDLYGDITSQVSSDRAETQTDVYGKVRGVLMPFRNRYPRSDLRY